MRRLFRILLIVALVVGGLWFAARAYLSSQGVTHKVTEHLAQMYGGPVQARQAEIGLKHTTIRGLQLFEEGAAPGQPPWLTADCVTADVSLWALVKGTAAPKDVTVTGAKVTLRFDKNGHLLTRLPTPSADPSGSAGTSGTAATASKPMKFPTIHADHSQLTLQKEGTPPTVVEDVKLDIYPEDGRVALHATGDNTNWGKLLLDGTLDRQKNELAVTLKSAGPVHVTQAMLDALPYISESVWHDVQITGITPAVLTVRHDFNRGTTHYRIDMEPRHTRVDVPIAGLKASDASGKLVVEDNVVRLSDVHGKAYAGEVRLSGDLDFTGSATHLDFSKLEAHGLDVHALPKSWGLPPQLDGRLDASGDVDLTLDKGKIYTAGTAHGEIRNARIAGQPVDGPIELQLSPEGPPLQTDTTQDCMTQEQDGKAPDKKAPHYLTVKMKLEKADLQQIVEKFKWHLPVQLTGRVSFQGKAGIPLNAGDEMAKLLRFNGKVTVNDAALGAVQLASADADAVYDKGLLRLEKLNGTLRGDEPGGKATGTFQGKMTGQFAPPGDLTATLAVQGLSLKQLAADLGLKGPGARGRRAVRYSAGRAARNVEGTLAGSVKVRVATADLKKIEAWQGDGRVTVPAGRVAGVALQDAAATVKLKDGVLSLPDLHAGIEGGTLKVTGTLDCKAPYRFKAAVDLRDADLAAVTRLPEDIRPSFTVGGKATLTADLRGTASPFRLDPSSGTVAGAGLRVDGITLTDVKFSWDADADKVQAKDVVAHVGTGAVTGSAEVPLRPKVAGGVNLTIKGIDVGELLKAQKLPLPIEGKADGVVKGTFPATVPGKERQVSLAVDLKSTKLMVQGVEASGLQGKLRYVYGELAYDLQAKTLGGKLELEGTVPSKIPEGQEAGGGTLKLEGVQLERLGRLRKNWQARGEFPLSGSADLRLSFRHRGPDRGLVGSGDVVLSDVAWDGVDWLPDVRGQLRLTPDQLLVEDATGTLAQGNLLGRMGVGLKPGVPSWFAVDLTRADASRLLAPWPKLRGEVRGVVNAFLHGRFGPQWTARGTITLDEGKIAGAEATGWRFPVDLAYVPADGRGRFEVRGGGGMLARGRTTAQATLTLGYERRLQGRLDFTNVDLRGLLHGAAETARLGGGKMTGRLDFSGRGLKSLNDLSASLNAKLAQAQGLAFPGLEGLLPVLHLSPSTNFQRGDVRARLTRSTLHFDRLALEGGPGDVVITGNMATSGRLNLDVRANLRSFLLNSNALSMVGVNLPVQVAVPGRFLNNTPLAGRTLNIRVTGTTRSPTVQIRPLSLLRG